MIAKAGIIATLLALAVMLVIPVLGMQFGVRSKLPPLARRPDPEQHGDVSLDALMEIELADPEEMSELFSPKDRKLDAPDRRR